MIILGIVGMMIGVIVLWIFGYVIDLLFNGVIG